MQAARINFRINDAVEVNEQGIEDADKFERWKHTRHPQKRSQSQKGINEIEEGLEH